MIPNESESDGNGNEDGRNTQTLELVGVNSIAFVNGVRVPCERTKTWKHEIKSPVEANSGRVTDRGEEG